MVVQVAAAGDRLTHRIEPGSHHAEKVAATIGQISTRQCNEKGTEQKRKGDLRSRLYLPNTRHKRI